MSNLKPKIYLSVLFVVMPVVVYAASPNIGEMMVNLKRDLPNLVKFIAAVSYLAGFWFIFSSLHELRIYGQARTMMPTNINLSGPLVRLIVGTLMVFLPSLIDTSIYTIWNYSSQDMLLYPESHDWGSEVTDGVIALIRVIGYIAFVRGLILITRSARQGAPHGMMSKGLTHIVGGILAVNAVGTVNAIKGTFGL